MALHSTNPAPIPDECAAKAACCGSSSSSGSSGSSSGGACECLEVSGLEGGDAGANGIYRNVAGFCSWRFDNADTGETWFIRYKDSDPDTRKYVVIRSGDGHEADETLTFAPGAGACPCPASDYVLWPLATVAVVECPGSSSSGASSSSSGAPPTGSSSSSGSAPPTNDPCADCTQMQSSISVISAGAQPPNPNTKCDQDPEGVYTWDSFTPCTHVWVKGDFAIDLNMGQAGAPPVATYMLRIIYVPLGQVLYSWQSGTDDPTYGTIYCVDGVIHINVTNMHQTAACPGRGIGFAGTEVVVVL